MTVIRVAAMVLVAAALAGCSGEATDSSPGSVPAAPTPSPEGTGSACDPDTTDAVQRSIAEQQAAFAAGDFNEAWEHASARFQSTISLRQFRIIIEGAYAFLIGNPSMTFVGCRSAGNTALVRVEVAGDPVVAMEYRMVDERGSWFIDSAGAVGTRQTMEA